MFFYYLLLFDHHKSKQHHPFFHHLSSQPIEINPQGLEVVVRHNLHHYFAQRSLGKVLGQGGAGPASGHGEPEALDKGGKGKSATPENDEK